MGKDKTDTDLVDCSNTKNDKKNSIEDKENSVKSKKLKGVPKFSLKVRTDLTAEVLEDENTNDSITSTNSKSNKSSSSSSSSHNSSSTSNNGKHDENNVKSPKKDNNTSKKTEEDNAKKFCIASNNPKEFKLRIVPLEKLLEKPPPPPKPATPPAKIIKKEIIPVERNRRLPQRRSKPVSFIELSDTEEEDEEREGDSRSTSSESVKVVTKKRGIETKDSKKKTPRNKSVSDSEDDETIREKATRKSVRNSADSKEVEPKKSAVAKKSVKELVQSEEDQPKSKSKSKKKTLKDSESDKEEVKNTKSKNKSLKDCTDSEGNESKKSKSKSATDIADSEEDETKKSKSKNKPAKQSSESEADESIKSTTKKKISSVPEKEEQEKSKSKENSAKETSVVETKTSKSKKSTKSSSNSEEELLQKSESINQLEKESSDSENLLTILAEDKPDKQSSDVEEEEPRKHSSKRKRSEKSTEIELDDSKSANPKKKSKPKSSESETDESNKKSVTKGREVRKKKAVSKDTVDNSTDSDEEEEPRKSVSKKKTSVSDESERVKQKKTHKSKKIQGPPPSPSTVRRCVVRVKRSKLSDFKDLGKNKSKRNMNGGAKSEKPSTSRRRAASSDEDSDYNFRRAAIADHDYSGRDIDDDDDDDDKASQKSSDSEVIPTRKRRVFRNAKDNSNNSDSDFEPKQKGKKKRTRVRRNSSDDSDNNDDDDDDDEKKKNKRKDIRKIIKSDDLNLTTKEAAKEEQERRKRIEERQKLYNQIYEKPDSIEVEELVLDFDAEKKTTLLEVDKGLMKKLKPHQVTGVKFMWDACFETIKDAQEKPGSGCILAHCMGLGKTMQIVTLSHTMLANSRKTNVERVLIISPLSTLNNWAREFHQWMRFTKKRNIEVYDMSKYKDKNTRIFKLNEWYEEGGVCIMGYDMYRILSNEKAKGLRKKQREHLLQSLVDPGPDLVVCDEGHLLKNEKTSISKAVTRMRTRRRIVLTGTPLQNNLKEYYCMIQFIKPNLLGTYKEYLNRFVNPISNGQYTDSTERDIRLMKHRSHILHKLLEGCIQRRDYSVLAPYLPPKHEYVVYTTLSMLQQLLYDHYMVHQRDSSSSSSEGKGAKLFQDFQELRRIWTHPMNMRINSDSVIRKKVLANDNDSLDDFICDDENDEDDGGGSSSDSSVDSSKSFGSGGGSGAAPSKLAKTRNFRRKAAEEGVEIESDIEEVEPPQQDDPSEWWKRFVADKELNNIHHSPKLVILMRLLEQCEAIGDKLLVFSQSLQSLDTIEHFLSLIDSKTRGYEYEGDVGDMKGFWKPGTDYFRLDGSCSVEQRESMCKKFNDSSNLRSRLFLISTRAGGLGINLVSANRVVIFDVSWNPSHDTQSIFRVYRFGQEKPCYIYRLIAMGTMEQKLYERQVAKQATAKRVIDEQQISRHYNQSDLQELYTYELKPAVPREIPILPKDRLFAELLSEHESLLFKYHEHDSLLENEESENLSAEERKAAWSEYEAEKTRAVQTAQYISYDRSAYGQYGNSSGSVTSNKIFGFRSDVLLQLLNMKIAKDHPEMSQNQVIQLVPTYLNELYSQMNTGDPTMYKELLSLHGTLTHPSGMYMNPLLYVNQNPSAAGYFQAGGQPVNGVVGMPMAGVPMVGAPMPGAPGIVGPPMMGVPAGAPQAAAAPGFDPNQVYEID